MISITEQIEDARKNLLDLSLRNHLVNFRPTKARTLRIIEEKPSDIYDQLVIKEKQMQFRATKPDLAPTQHIAPQKNSPLPATVTDNAEIKSALWVPEVQAFPDSHSPSDRFLNTPFDSETLKSKLSRIAQESRTVLEEQGYTVLYLAVGFLEWYESPTSTKPVRAPLILIPVELIRQEIRQSFKLAWTSEDIITNISLKQKLSEQGILLPDFEMPDNSSGIEEYFRKVKNSISNYQNWNLYSDIFLDFFSFSKFVMYKDLDVTSWPDAMSPVNHPLLNAVFNPDPDISNIIGFNPDDVDQKIRAESVYHILDADSSQIAVIEDIKAGKNLVVEGPPGTGKSQTIANAIADLLASGKTVLFISEKMAALEVVKKRLDEVGLGDFCLELHSRKATIKEMHRKLDQTLHFSPPPEINFTEDLNNLENLKSELNDYIRALTQPIGDRKLTPFILFGQNEKIRKHFSQSSHKIVRFPIPNAEKITEQQWQSTINLLHHLAIVLPKVGSVQRNPWYGCNPGIVHESDLEKIKSMTHDTITAFFELQKKMATLAEMTGLSYMEDLTEIENAIGATKLFISPNPVDRNILLNTSWNQPNPQIDIILHKISEFKQLRERILKQFNSLVFDQNLDAFLQEFQPLTQKFFLIKLFDSRLKLLKRNAETYYLDHNSHTETEILNDFTYIAHANALLHEIRNYGGLGKSLFGTLWQGENSDIPQLKEFSIWIVQFRHTLLEEIFTEKTVEMMSQGIAPKTIEKSAEELTHALQEFLQQKYALFEKIGFSVENRFCIEERTLELSKYQLLFSGWEQNVIRLPDWCDYVTYSNDCKNTSAAQYISIIENNEILREDVVTTFEGNYIEEMLHRAFNERPILGKFRGDVQEQKIQSFVDLDKKIIESNRLRLIWKLYRDIPRIENEVSPFSELGILKGQLEKQRGKMPIRQLMNKTGNLIQKIKPCFMMGPLSVAQFLDPKTVKFDVIIFDEASQVKPEDAIGALLRGNQAVVIGDSMQLPPTSFFDRMIESDDTDNSTAMISDMESILNLCRISFPTKILRWHYRSRHESLIALSNQEFYKNNLLVYPSPMHRTEEIGLQFVHLPNTTYDRGGSKVNLAEAQAVAQAVFEHFKKNPRNSLGVGTFSLSQQNAIRDEIDKLRYQNPDLEEYFQDDRHENFFVKNLETIQGDERDVIFLSVGYGKDYAGKLYQNFGPLNHEGGERRLNVIITRARERCIVFSNFTSRDLEVTESSPLGVKILKLFLEYAETGNLSEKVSTGETESPFEDAVCDFLTLNHYQIHKQVGCAGFRIDLAIVDNREPGTYLMGIECDGAQYHSSKVARDRDRLRQQILEKLNWKIHRVWSTDWYKNPAETKRTLLAEIEKAKTNPICIRQSDSNQSQIKITTRLDPVHMNQIVKPIILAKRDDITIPAYAHYTGSANEYFGNIDDMSSEKLERIIYDIISVEGPIHYEELCTRLKTTVIIPKMTQKIRDNILKNCNNLASQNMIHIHDMFLWPQSISKTILRKRDPTHSINLDWICDQEISEAINHVLRQQYASTKQGIIEQTLKFFGINRKTERLRSRIYSLIDAKIRANELVVLPNDMIDLKK